MKTLNSGVIVIENESEFDKLKRDNVFTNKCIVCGKYRAPTKFRNHRINNYKLMMCCDCLYKHTSTIKYGVNHPTKAKSVKEKNKKTCIEKYGVEYTLQSPEIREKIKQTSIKVYGTKNPSQSEVVKKKIKKTCLEKYGVERSLQSPEIREKIKQTCIEKYNVDNPWKSDIVKEKIRKTNTDRYGVPYPGQSDIVKQKMKQTSMNKYGVEYYTQTEESRKHSSDIVKQYRLDDPEMFLTKRYIYNGEKFDSIPEFCVYLFCIYHWIPIVRNHKVYYEYKDIRGVNHLTYPDFIINGKLVEIKGGLFFKDDGTLYLPWKGKLIKEEYEYRCDLYERKRQCLINNGVLILKDTDPWVQNCINWVKNIININLFLKSNPNNLFYGYTPYNYNKNKMYQESIGIGLTPFDIFI